MIPPPRVVDGVTEHREIAWEKVSGRVSRDPIVTTWLSGHALCLF